MSPFFNSKNVHIQTDSQDHSERLLSKEWLVKIDNEKSIPYLMVRPSYSTFNIFIQLRRRPVEATPNFRRSNMRLSDNRY